MPEVDLPGAAFVAPRILAPQRATIFADRARRFDELAQGHALGDWLRFLGSLTRAQHAVLQEFRNEPVLDAESVELARNHGMPPASAQEWRPREAWRECMAAVVAGVYDEAPPDARRSLERLRKSTSARLDALVERVLRADLQGADADLLPFVGASLQVLWTTAAAALGSSGIRPIGVAGVCPCCGSLPVASVVRDAGGIRNLRYLHCSLCNTEWNAVRARCPSCDGIAAYRYVVEARSTNVPAIRAETCDHCKSYLKIVYIENAPRGDAIADDLATLALDVLVDEAGYQRAGPNLLFVPG